MDKIYLIPTSVYADFEASLKKVNKIATKLGVTGYTVDILGTEIAYVNASRDAIKRLEIEADKVIAVMVAGGHDTQVDGGSATNVVVTKVPVEVTKIQLSGDIPVVAGYSFVGVIDPATGISRSAPGENIPANLITRFGSCDHCQKTRARNTTIVVKKGTTYKVVGSGCVKDFLGASARDLEITAKNLADYYEFLSDFEEMISTGGWTKEIDPVYALRDVLYWTYAAIKVYGWVSKGAAYQTPLTATSNYTGILLNGPTARGKDRKPTLYEAVMEDLTSGTKYRPLKNGETSAVASADVANQEGGLLDKAIAWAQSLGDDNPKDYLRNLSILTKESTPITYKELGLACSLIATYEREMGRELEKAERVETFKDKWNASAFLGDKGTKITANVEVLKISELAGEWGPVKIIKMGTDDGHLLTWFASSSTLPVGLREIGGKTTIKGTIKGTNEYNGIKETIITRVTSR